jgi:PAS domain S-box-containing protein
MTPETNASNHSTAPRESEDRYRTLFEGAVEGIYVSTPDGQFLDVNPAMARILGYRAVAELRALLPERVQQLYVSPTRRAEFFAHLGAGDRVTDFESEVRRPDGSTVWICENVRAERDAQGRILRLQGFVSEVTARRGTESALRASEDRYRQLFEQSPVAIIEIDSRATVAWLQRLREAGERDLAAWFAREPDEAARMTGHIPVVGVNRAALTLLGARSLAEILENLARCFTAEALQMRRQALIAVWKGQRVVDGETRIAALDGAVRTVYQRWWVPMDGERPMFERTQLAFIDLTGAKSAESALAAERERLDVTLRAMTESVVTIDSTGVVKFMNAAAGALIGWVPAEAVGRPIDAVCVLSDEKTKRPLVAPVATALAAGRPVDLPSQTVLRSRGGTVRRIEGRCAPMRDPAGRGLGAVLVMRDVTDRARFEAEILRASKLESVGLLAGGIAHDFNNLLAIVMGNLTLALLDEKTAAAGGKWLREAERGTTRARELTQQLLTFARGGEPVRSAILLSDLVREAAEFALHGTAVRCEFDLADDVRPADADKAQIGQVVQNLVINAVQAMPAGGVIRLALRNETVRADPTLPLAPGQYLRLEISDQGAGIAPENLPRIFEPFFTTKELGTGLGLATVYSIVQKHRGHITVESEAGQGATFRIWLPAADAIPAPAVVTHSPFERMRGRVLFMDDEEPIRSMTRSLLERLGLEVTLTSNGHEAVQNFAHARASGQPFDVVIMDLTVPGGMGGAAAMSEILKLDPDARGIVSSGYSSDPVLANHRAHGFRGSVPKPYKVSDFARTLRTVLAEK